MKNYQLELRQIVDFLAAESIENSYKPYSQTGAFAQADAPVFFIMSFFAPMPTSEPLIGA